MKISLIIPTHKEEKEILDCLQAALKNPPDNLLEVIVVDTGADNTAQIASAFEKVRVVVEGERGLGRARQRGFVEAKGDLLAYLDADTRMTDGWYDIVNESFSQDENLVLLTGPYDYYGLPKTKKILVDAFLDFISKPALLLTGCLAYGGNFVVRREALKKIGGFNENLFAAEDTDVYKRIKKVGKTLFLKKLSIPASGRRLAKEGLVKTSIYYTVNHLGVTFIKKPIVNKYKSIR